MAQRKAAIQMSLGFIVTVVFAIVMLSLALTWLRGMIGGISGVTDDLTQQAQSNLRDAFRETGANFAVWPSQYELDRGAGIIMQAGIENDAPDGLSHFFMINVVPAAVSESICPGGNPVGCTGVGGMDMAEYMNSWVTFDKEAGPVAINSLGFKRMDITIPAEAKSGTYMFRVMACYDASSNPTLADMPSACDLSAPIDKFWGNPQPVTIKVK